MTFMPNRLAPARRPLPATVIPRMEVMVGKFLEADLEVVRFVTRATNSKSGRLFAILVSKLGNGWIYPILAAVVFFAWGWDGGKRIILIAGVNAGLMHILYPIIKRRIKRLRPFKVDPGLPSLLKTLDEHSFPSGHAMTLAGVLTPLVLLWPASAIAAVVMSVCMAWSRVATGHHYPSDVFAGAALGVGLGYPLSVCCLACW